VCIRIQVSAATVKALHTRLQQAYLKDDVRLVRRITGVIDLLVHHVPVEVLHTRWGLSLSCLYPWRQACLLRGMDSLGYHHSGGRRPKLTPHQKKRLVALLEAGPQVVGCETACGTSVRIRVLSWRECGVLSTASTCVHYGTTWGFRCKRLAVCRTLSTPPGASPGCRRNGR
jgi:transposase